MAIVATDVNQPMLDLAATIGASRPVDWRQADTMQLPFDDMAFDHVVCQFGAMFFTDKVQAFKQIRRVLKPGGAFVFNVYRIEESEFVDTVSRAVQALFPSDPPRFMERIPHGYFDHHAIARDLEDGGFADFPTFNIVPARSLAASANIAAVAYCQGTPLRGEIEARDPTRVSEAIDAAERALVERVWPRTHRGKNPGAYLDCDQAVNSRRSQCLSRR